MSRPVPKVAKSRMWTPMSPSTPLEPWAEESRQSQRSSVRQSPQWPADEPALQVAGLDVADGADLAFLDHAAGGLQRAGVAVGEVHHVDEAGGLGGVGHLERRRWR